MTKTATVNTATIGQTFTYSVEVKNLGDDDAQSVTMTDTLPAGVTYISTSAPANVTCSEASGLVTCDLGTIPNGGAVVIGIECAPRQPACKSTGRQSARKALSTPIQQQHRHR
ncbi:MAG: DUF11 domain-containing protein [Caldilineaceae bacterium]